MIDGPGNCIISIITYFVMYFIRLIKLLYIGCLIILSIIIHVYCKCLYINFELSGKFLNNKLFIFFLEFPNGIV